MNAAFWRDVLVSFAVCALIGAVIVSFAGCRAEDVRLDRVCVDPAAVDCVIRCAEAANPKSDEEGEDLVAQCDRTCSRLVCSAHRWVYWDQGWFDCEQSTGHYAKACARVNP